MKLIHTYAPSRDFFRFNKITAQNMLLSLFFAKKYFKHVELYATNEIADIVKKLKFPYDKIIVLDEFETLEYKTFSIPKLITYSKQTENFVHIDLDTFLYEKIDVNFNIPYFYHHNEINLDVMNNYQMCINLTETYLKNAHQLIKIVPHTIIKYIDVRDIPNMNVFGSTNPKIASESAKICLSIYEKNKDFFDAEYSNASIIEQLLIPATIKSLHGSNYQNHYITNSTKNFSFNSQGNNLNTANYPIEIKFDDCVININDEEHLFQFVNYDFRTIVHLSGYKNMDVFQFLVRETIIERFGGIELILNLDELFNCEIPGEEISKKYYSYMMKSFSNRFDKLVRNKLII